MTAGSEPALAGRGVNRPARRRQQRTLLHYLGIATRADDPAETLKYLGESRLGLARALALEPRHLLLDEPAAAMTVPGTDAVSSLIGQIRDDFACGILLIARTMRLVSVVCGGLHVLSAGRAVDGGTPQAVRSNPAFRVDCLGTEYAG